MPYNDLINLGATPSDPILGDVQMSAEMLNSPLLPQTAQPNQDGRFLPKRSLSQNMMDIGSALLVADQEGAGSAVKYLQGLQQQREKDELIKQKMERQEQLKEYELLGRIRERQLAELQAQRKLELARKLKERNPDLADIIDLDPKKAAEVMASQQMPKDRKIVSQNGVSYYADTGERVLPNVATESPERKVVEQGGILYYQDTGERVLPQIQTKEDMEQIENKGVRGQFEKGLGRILNYAQDLESKGGFTQPVDDLGDLISNPLTYMASTGPGQHIGRAFNTETQQVRDKLQAEVPKLFLELRKQGGLTGKELDTMAEREFYLQGLFKSGAPLPVILDTLKSASEDFGTGELSSQIQGLQGRNQNKPKSGILDDEGDENDIIGGMGGVQVDRTSLEAEMKRRGLLE